jgi:hypothetical protein
LELTESLSASNTIVPYNITQIEHISADIMDGC